MPLRALAVGTWSQVPPARRVCDFRLAPLHALLRPLARAERGRGWALASFALLDGGPDFTC